MKGSAGMDEAISARTVAVTSAAEGRGRARERRGEGVLTSHAQKRAHTTSPNLTMMHNFMHYPSTRTQHGVGVLRGRVGLQQRQPRPKQAAVTRLQWLAGLAVVVHAC